MRDFSHLTLEPIATIRTGFKTKFGIPRQPSLIPELLGKIVFEKKYVKDGMLRGIEGFSHLILIWGFSAEKKENYAPMVRPPKLGGNTKVGVFATRSPNRPNPLGLSVVKLEKVSWEKGIPVLLVSGVDMLDHTPIYDIKPYLPYADSYPQAASGFAKGKKEATLEVDESEEKLSLIEDPLVRVAIIKILKQDPRPGYYKEHEPERKCAFEYDRYHLEFHVEGNNIVLDNVSRLK